MMLKNYFDEEKKNDSRFGTTNFFQIELYDVNYW